MFRFSCFTPSNYQRTKKVRRLGGKMHSNLQEKSEGLIRNVDSGSSRANPKADENNISTCSVEQTTDPSFLGDHRKSVHLNSDSHVDTSEEFPQMPTIRKSQSLGCILDKAKICPDGNFTDNEVDQRVSFNYPDEETVDAINDPFDDDKSTKMYTGSNLGTDIPNQQRENDSVGSFAIVADDIHHESLFSINGSKQSESDVHDDIGELSSDLILPESGCLSLDYPTAFARSQSVNNLSMEADKSRETEITHRIVMPRARSFEHLHLLNEGRNEFQVGDEGYSPKVCHYRHIDASDSYDKPQESDEDRKSSSSHVDSGEEKPLSDTSVGLTEDQDLNGKYWEERSLPDHKITTERCVFPVYIAPENERGVPAKGDVKLKNLQPQSPIENLNELNPKELSNRRIEEWISQIDIGSGSLVEEPGESSCSFSSQETQLEINVPPIKPDARSNFATEVAYNYISSLNATSTSAHMANIGLVAVPLLSGFSSLRMLNLSGNSIVRITAGSLPKGLHMLNLSKNNIATIEGLRDLTRLRVLDLSHNRIIRIGHGLASCSSLKELYLSGNKISEVEGLHRLLKLNLLDLRGNKISTAKGLGQLAANYISLQSIYLEGNPAQRNVGDEHLKKYLLSLLPNLAYYNKHAIKVSGAKEISDRQYDRGKRVENKKLLTQRGSHSSGLRKSALNHVRSNPSLTSLLKQSKGRHVEGRHARLPPLGSKPTTYPLETSGNMVSSQPISTIRRIQSEGAL